MTKKLKPVLPSQFHTSLVRHLPSHQSFYVCSPSICLPCPIVLPFPSNTHTFFSSSPPPIHFRLSFHSPSLSSSFPSIPFSPSTFPCILPPTLSDVPEVSLWWLSVFSSACSGPSV